MALKVNHFTDSVKCIIRKPTPLKESRNCLKKQDWNL